MANLITGQTHHYGLGEAVRPKGVPPMSNCRGFPHERLHQDGNMALKIITIPTRIAIRF
ncbi:MAG: hypothetical protein F6K63_21170 [Moorea sp. SIO1G6]|uniref:hypothetical protein n=1 Tax=Moorena sp. SIO1G6 TaxID=2607840 RepID=UPI0013C1FA8C|nr:hypothetical protein [Moorena sp. SIO1G6]NET66761.1 hypothetical protein [Moorena sp. SIO1G6]